MPDTNSWDSGQSQQNIDGAEEGDSWHSLHTRPAGRGQEGLCVECVDGVGGGSGGPAEISQAWLSPALRKLTSW